MNYLLDKKLKRKRSLVFFLLLFVLILLYFRNGVLGGLASGSHFLFRPVLVFGGQVGEKLSSVKSFFLSKNSLFREKEDLQFKLLESEAKNLHYNSLLDENIKLKEMLGQRAGEGAGQMVLSAILGWPNRSLYDTFIIDAGRENGLRIGDAVFALGAAPIGRVSDVYSNSSKVLLFSGSGGKTQAVIAGKDIFVEVVGRGGGNFEMILPRDLALSPGDQLVLPGLIPRVLAVVEGVISDPRDPFQKALLKSPANVRELKFVQVEISAN